MKPYVTLGQKDSFPMLQRALMRLRDDRVLVGIPEDRSGRRRSKREPINNAQLLFIHSNGSPLRGIPKRMVIEPAITAEDNREHITGWMAKAMAAEISGDHAACTEFLAKAGVAGVNASKAWFTDPRNGWPPNTRRTVLRKLRKLKGSARKAVDAADANDEDLGQFDAVLRDTSQMFRALTYVVVR